MKKTKLLVALIIAGVINAQEINIIPKPVELKKASGVFIINNQTYILAYLNPQIESANLLNFYLDKLYGFTLPVNLKIA